jgi:hypothetical protein
MRLKRRIKRTSGGDYELKLPSEERVLLRSLPGQLRKLLDTDDPSVFRLFPSAYPDDPERDKEFSQLMRDDLLAHHRAGLETMEATVDATRLDNEQMEAWLSAINQLRLVLGTRLDITEGLTPEVPRDDPRGPLLAVYHYLSWLQDQVVDALSE